VAAIRRPQPSILAAHYDQRVEKRAGFFDLLGETFGVRGREVALKRRWLNCTQRQDCKHKRPTRERLVIRADCSATRIGDLGDERRDFRGVELEPHLLGREPALFLARRQSTARRTFGVCALGFCARCFFLYRHVSDLPLPAA